MPRTRSSSPRVSCSLRGGGVRGAHVHARWRPPVVEESSVAQSLELARAAGARLQIAHASTAHAVELVSRARGDGVPATVETCPHYLFLDETALERHGTFAKINPPLRSAETVAALWDKVAAGEVDVIGSDHSPFLVEEKVPDDGDVWKALPGAPGLEAMVPLLLTALDDGRLRLEQVLALTSGECRAHLRAAGEGAARRGRGCRPDRRGAGRTVAHRPIEMADAVARHGGDLGGPRGARPGPLDVGARPAGLGCGERDTG